MIEVEEQLPLGSEELEIWHKTAVSTVQMHFTSRTATFQPHQIAGFRDGLEKEINKLFETLNSTNEKKARESISALLSQAFSTLEEDLSCGKFESWNQFDKERRAAKEKFVSKAPKHPRSSQALVEYLEEFTGKAAAKIFTTLTIKAESAESKAQEAVSAMKLEVLKEKFELEKQVEEMKTLLELQNKWEHDRTDQSEELQELRQRIEGEREQHKLEIEKLSSELTSIEEKLAEHSEVSHTEPQQTASARPSRTEAENHNDELQRSCEELRAQMQQLQTENQELARKNTEMQSGLVDAQQQLQELQQSMKEVFRQERSDLEQDCLSDLQLAALCTKLKEIQTSISVHRPDLPDKIVIGDLLEGKIDVLKWNETIHKMLQQLQDSVDDVVRENQLQISEDQSSPPWMRSANGSPDCKRSSPTKQPKSSSTTSQKLPPEAVASRLLSRSRGGSGPGTATINGNRSYLLVPESFNSPTQSREQIDIQAHSGSQSMQSWNPHLMDEVDAALEARIGLLESNLMSTRNGGPQSLEPPRLVVTCKIPGTHTHTSSGKSFTLYDMLLRLSNGQTSNQSHRFSDFQHLHKRVSKLFPRLELPKVASELFSGKGNRWFNRLDTEFVELRRRKLEHFVNFILADKKLETCRPFRMFIAKGICRSDDPTLMAVLNAMDAPDDSALGVGEQRNGISVSNGVDTVISTYHNGGTEGLDGLNAENSLDAEVTISQEFPGLGDEDGVDQARTGNTSCKPKVTMSPLVFSP